MITVWTLGFGAVLLHSTQDASHNELQSHLHNNCVQRSWFYLDCWIPNWFPHGYAPVYLARRSEMINICLTSHSISRWKAATNINRVLQIELHFHLMWPLCLLNLDWEFLVWLDQVLQIFNYPKNFLRVEWMMIGLLLNCKKINSNVQTLIPQNWFACRRLSLNSRARAHLLAAS